MNERINSAIRPARSNWICRQRPVGDWVVTRTVGAGMDMGIERFGPYPTEEQARDVRDNLVSVETR